MAFIFWPVKSSFGGHPPDASKVGRALAAQRGDRVAPHGATAANQLGLTKQVHVREVYLTSGRSRSLKLGRLSNLDPYINGNWFCRDDRQALNDPFAASFGCNFPERRLWATTIQSEPRTASSKLTIEFNSQSRSAPCHRATQNTSVSVKA